MIRKLDSAIECSVDLEKLKEEYDKAVDVGVVKAEDMVILRKNVEDLLQKINTNCVDLDLEFKAEAAKYIHSFRAISVLAANRLQEAEDKKKAKEEAELAAAKAEKEAEEAKEKLKAVCVSLGMKPCVDEIDHRTLQSVCDTDHTLHYTPHRSRTLQSGVLFDVDSVHCTTLLERMVTRYTSVLIGR